MLKVMNYIPPNGKRELVEITNIYPEDADFFNHKGLNVSMEQMHNTFILYSQTGNILGEEDVEVIHIVPEGQSSFDAFKELRNLVEQELTI